MIPRILAAAAITLSLSACGGGKPSNDEIKSALSKKVTAKGCVTSTVFDKALAKRQTIDRYNQSTMDAVIAAGLVKKSESGYEFTDLGKSTWDENYSGFCYTDKYDIKDIKIIKQEDKMALAGSPFTEAWYVSFKISPSSVGDWVNTPQILAQAKPDSMTNEGDSKDYTVTLARKGDGGDLLVEDFRFSFSPSIIFHQGF